MAILHLARFSQIFRQSAKFFVPKFRTKSNNDLSNTYFMPTCIVQNNDDLHPSGEISVLYKFSYRLYCRLVVEDKTLALREKLAKDMAAFQERPWAKQLKF